MSKDNMNNEIEKKIANAVKAETPDILDDLFEEIDSGNSASVKEHPAPEKVTVKKQARGMHGRKPWFTALAGIAAVMILFTGIRTMMNIQNEAFAVVGLDVNPGIELKVNQKERVVSAEAINDEGREILDGMDLKGSDVNVACNAMIGSMLTKGYLTTETNSVLVSVSADDTEKGKALEAKLSQNLSHYLENSEIAAAILGQFVENDDELKTFAEENGISSGKAWLIRKLLNTGSKNMTEESLLKLSTQELILLGQNRKVSEQDSYGSASTSKYIGEDKAEEAALKDAKLTADQADMIKVEFDCEDGRIIYEVEFKSGEYEYEYDIDAVSGKVISSDVEKNGEKEDSDEIEDDSGEYGGDDDDLYDDDDRFDNDDNDDDNDRDDDDDHKDDDDENDDNDDDDKDDKDDD